MPYRRPMRLTRHIRVGLIGAAALAIAAVGATTTGRPPVDRLQLTHGVPGTAHPPINTAKVYRWGNAAWNDGFIGPLSKNWDVSHGAPTIQNQHGQLTLNGPGGLNAKTLWASYPLTAHQYGRWDFSMRSKQYTFGATPYAAVLELVPSDNSRIDCGRQNLILAKFPLGAKAVTGELRNAGKRWTMTNPHEVFSNEFHTYALEVTAGHISWFMEGKVLMTVRNPAALSGETYKIKIFLTAAPSGQRTNRGRLQFDWARYYTLARPNAKSISAPEGEISDLVTLCGSTAKG